MWELASELARRRREHLYRTRRVVEGPQGAEITVDGRELVAFCSNDYLGLAADPRVRQALIDGVGVYGAGSGAAHLVSGHTHAHHRLEEELAEFTGHERALLFSTGYMANLGVITALTGRGDTVFEDRLNHASLIDGGLLSAARFRRYPHADAAALRGQLTGVEGRKLVVTDGVFSMDGDIAPLTDLASVCRAQGAWLMVDDAHGLGVVGQQGRGSLSRCGLDGADAPLLMGTLGKALGTFGAFVAGSTDLIETLIQQARPYIYTTASPAALAEATRVSLRIARDEDWRRQRLLELTSRFRQEVAAMGFDLMPSESPIQPVVAGSSARALEWSRTLENEGILVTAIRPPTVPPGSARLRFTFSAVHTDTQLDRLLDALQRLSGSAI